MAHQLLLAGKHRFDPAVLDAAIGEAISRGRIPGAALAIICRGDILFSKGYGRVTTQADASAIGPQTFYPPASTIKAMTSTVIGMLVDDGVLAWDVPIRRYLAEFVLADEEISRRVTLRDLLTMRTGLPAHEFMWMANEFDRATLLRRLPHLDLSAGLGERFQYNNLGYAIAGHIAEREAGQAWEQLMRDRLFLPLGMDGARFDIPEHGDVVASYHEGWRRELVRTDPWLSAMIAPAGGTLYATMNDMARWVAFNLNEGGVGGRQLIAPQTFSEIMTPNIAMGADGAAPSPAADYALGWFVDQYHGDRRISHTGYLDDVNSCVTLFPDEGLGFVAYTTFASSRLSMLINELAFDVVTDHARSRAIARAQAAYDVAIEKRIAARPADPAQYDLEVPSGIAHVGSYHHDGYGTIEIAASSGGLELHWNHLNFRLRPIDDRRWVAVGQGYWEIHKANPFDDDHPIIFDFDDDAAIALFIALEPAVHPIRFMRAKAGDRALGECQP